MERAKNAKTGVNVPKGLILRDKVLGGQEGSKRKPTAESVRLNESAINEWSCCLKP